MIEIGRERSSASRARRAASVFGTMSVLLLLVWLVRVVLSISQYSEDILLSSFALVLLSRVFRTRTSVGAGRAVSSFLWNLAASCILILIAIWFLHWVASVQGTTFPSVIYSQVPNLVIVAILTGLLAYAVRELTPRRENPLASGPPILVRAGSAITAGKTTLSTKTDTIALLVKKSGRTIGSILLGDVKSSFETPMGTVTATFAKPVTAFGIPFKGAKAGKDDVSRLTGEDLDQLIKEARVDTTSQRLNGESHNVDLPFVHVREDWLGESVDVGPISVRKGPAGETVRIGPFRYDSEEDGDRKDRWFARGGQDSSFLSGSNEEVSAKWNGSSLWLKGDSMKLTTGADGFFYSPTEVQTFSPLHTLHVLHQKVTLNTKKFALDITGDRVVLRAEDGSKSTDSKTLAQGLRDIITEEAKKHIRDVIEGLPIDLDEMLASIEEVLKKNE